MHDVHNIGKLNSSTGLKEIHAFIEHIYQLQFLCSWLWRCDLTESPLKKNQQKPPKKHQKQKQKTTKTPQKRTNQKKNTHTHEVHMNRSYSEI